MKKVFENTLNVSMQSLKEAWAKEEDNTLGKCVFHIEEEQRLQDRTTTTL